MPKSERDPGRKGALSRGRTPTDVAVTLFTSATIAIGGPGCTPREDPAIPRSEPKAVSCLDDTRVAQYNRFPIRGISPDEARFTPRELLANTLSLTRPLDEQVNRDPEMQERLFTLFDAMLAQVNRGLLSEGGEPTIRQDHLNLLTMAFIDPAIEEKYPELARLTKPFRIPTPDTTDEQKQAAAGGVLDFLDRVGIVSNDALTDPNDPNMCLVIDGTIRVVSGPYKGMIYPDILHLQP